MRLPFKMLLFVFLVETSVAEAERSVEKNCVRLCQIVMPLIAVENERPHDVVEFINQRWLEIDPNVSGFDFVLVEPEAFMGKRITIVGKNLKMHQIAGMLADQLGAHLVVADDSIRFTPANADKQAPDVGRK